MLDCKNKTHDCKDKNKNKKRLFFDIWRKMHMTA